MISSGIISNNRLINLALVSFRPFASLNNMKIKKAKLRIAAIIVVQSMPIVTGWMLWLNWLKILPKTPRLKGGLKTK